MTIAPQHVIALAAVDADLHVVRLVFGVQGVTIETRTVVQQFLERSEALSDALGGRFARARLVFVCDGSWCAARPMPITCAQWGGAKEEVLQSLDRMLPFSGADALVGLVDLRDAADHGSAVGGRLVALRRATVEPWIGGIERALGRRPDLTISPEMAMLGLGFDHDEVAQVVHQSGPAPIAHRLAGGAPVGMGDRADSSIARTLCLPGADETFGESIDGAELAIAGALSERVAPEYFQPLVGDLPSRAWRWAPAAAALLLAGIAYTMAGPVHEARVEAAIDQLQAQRESLVDDFNELQRTKARVERLGGLLNAFAGVRDGWSNTLPALRDVVDALPAETMLYRIQVRGDTVDLTGEASAVRTVLEGLAQSERIEDAALTAPLTRSLADESLDVFSIRARWTGEGAGS